MNEMSTIINNYLLYFQSIHLFRKLWHMMCSSVHPYIHTSTQMCRYSHTNCPTNVFNLCMNLSRIGNIVPIICDFVYHSHPICEFVSHSHPTRQHQQVALSDITNPSSIIILLPQVKKDLKPSLTLYCIKQMKKQMMKKQMMTKQMAKRKHAVTVYFPQHDHGNDEEEDNNSLSADIVNFPYEWEDTPYYSDDYTTLIHRFRQQARETDATKDNTASIETRCGQVNHLTYLQTCFQRMADDESCGFRELYYNCHSSFIENEISTIESQINQLEHEQKQ